MIRSGRGMKFRRFVALLSVVAIAGLTALLAESSDNTEGAAVYAEVRAYLEATANYSIPKPGAVPLAEAQLMAAAAKVREGLAPDKAQVRRQARLETIEAVHSAYSDQLLADDSIVGVGIGLPSTDKGSDWDLLVLMTADANEEDAARALETAGVSALLTDFGVRYERIHTPIPTADERPGKTRVWAGAQANEACVGVATMGWLVQSKQVDEVYVNGDRTDQQSIGFLTVLHGTAPGPAHTWEEFQTVPREIEWSNFGDSCFGFSSAGQVIRSGPHAGLAGVGDITQDIDFVSLYAERACDQAGVDNASEGLPTCEGFDDAVFGYNTLAVPVDVDEIDTVRGMTAQICGGKTGEVRSGELDAIHVDLELPVLDWDDNPVVPAVSVHIQDTFRIVNELTDPDFAVKGDSGGPVWLLDDNAMGNEGAWRPLGVQAAISFNGPGTLAYSFVTPLPDNLSAYDVNIIYNNPRDPEDDFCSSCNCDCRAESFGVGPREGRLLLDTALATSPGGVSQLTSLAVRNQDELASLLEARDSGPYKEIFEESLAPYIRAAFNPPSSRPKLTGREVSSTLQILAWIHNSVRSKEVQDEASKWYRFVAVYGSGRDFQELVRLYFLTSPTQAETKLALF